MCLNMDYLIVVREATTEDRIALWDWRNDPVIRPVYQADPVVKYRQHCLWFERVLKSEHIILYIGVVEVLRVGCVQFDLSAEGTFEVGLYIKPLYCGKGIGPLLLSPRKACLKLSRYEFSFKISFRAPRRCTSHPGARV